MEPPAEEKPETSGDAETVIDLDAESTEKV